MGTRSVSDVDAHVARRLRLARRGLGLTQKQLADQIGVTFQQVQKYENGSNRISAGRLHQIADVLGLDLTSFFSEVPPQSSAKTNRLSNDDFGLLATMNELNPQVRKAVAEFLRTVADV